MRGRVFRTALIAALAVGTTASTALAQEPVVTAPAPGTRETVKYRIERGPNIPLVVTGSILFIGGYGGALAAGWASDRKEYDQMYIPIAGPFLTLAERGSCAVVPCRGTTGEKVFLAADGLIQTFGLVSAVAGLIFPETHLVPIRVGSSSVRVQVAPGGGPGGAGVSAFGSF